MKLPFINKKSKEDEITTEDIDQYLKSQFADVSKFIKELDTRIKNLEAGSKAQITPSPVEQRVSNTEQAILALAKDLTNVANDHLMLKSIARYRKEFKHLQPLIQQDSGVT